MGADRRRACRPGAGGPELPRRHAQRLCSTRALAGVTLIVLAVLVIGIAADGTNTDLGGAGRQGRAGGRRRGGTACSSPPACCSSPSPDTRGSPPWARRCATRCERSRRRSSSRWVIAIGVYPASRLALLAASGPDALASATAPLAEAAHDAGSAGLAPLARIGRGDRLARRAARVDRRDRPYRLAMARHRDLPRWLAAVHPRFQMPHHAEMALAAVVERWFGRRPARRDRLLVVRRAAVLRHRERLGLDSAGAPTTMAAGAQRPRRRRVSGTGGDAAVAGDRSRALR